MMVYADLWRKKRWLDLARPLVMWAERYLVISVALVAVRACFRVRRRSIRTSTDGPPGSSVSPWRLGGKLLLAQNAGFGTTPQPRSESATTRPSSISVHTASYITATG